MAVVCQEEGRVIIWEEKQSRDWEICCRCREGIQKEEEAELRVKMRAAECLVEHDKVQV